MGNEDFRYRDDANLVRGVRHERTRLTHAAARSMAYLRCHYATFAEVATMDTEQTTTPSNSSGVT
jgi:hypothetical protein